jgi:hypothetical protein
MFMVQCNPLHLRNLVLRKMHTRSVAVLDVGKPSDLCFQYDNERPNCLKDAYQPTNIRDLLGQYCISVRAQFTMLYSKVGVCRGE